ncbi:uncharacterized protein LOC129969408 [Argiope bruennichi]|uniref:uncharacterized protein LOC129969408 n=1 Tax=Argiope bruennichi TaxID=94029 RepID=UPI0024940D80|nr:uncharacterized protein LOC129969408 [Argiope bruennichi]
MKFPILVIIYVFVQTSSCTESDVPAEELIHTNPMVSTSAYPALNTDPGTEEVLSNNSPTVPSLMEEALDSRQNSYDTTTSSNLHSPSTARITWNPVNSVVLSTDTLTRSPDHENSFSSDTLQNITQHSATNVLNYQTPPSIFENLDHEENELDSDTRVTDIPKGLKTTGITDLPSLYSPTLETVGSESSADDQHISFGNEDHLLSESKNESISRITTKLHTSFEDNVTGISLLPVSDHIAIQDSATTTDFSNQELSAENKETSTLLTRSETIMSDSNLFGSNKTTSENLFRDNIREDENIENATFTTDSIKFSQDENLISTMTSNIERDAENREQEFSFHNSSLDPNFTYAETSKDSELVKTQSFSEKNIGLEMTSQLDLVTTPTSSFFDLSEKIAESATTVVLKNMNIDNLTPATASETLSPDISPNTGTSSSTISALPDESLLQNSSDFSQKFRSINTEVSTSESSYSTSIKSSDLEILSISTLTDHNKLSTTTDNSIITMPLEINVNSISHLNNATVITESEISKETTLVNPTVSESTAISSGHSIPGLSDIAISTYSYVNTFEDASKLLTTIDPNTMTEHYHPSTKKLSTTISNDVEESNTVSYVPSHKHMDRESSTDSFIEQSTAPQIIPHDWPPTARTQLPTTIASDIEEAKSSTIAFIPSHKDRNRETAPDVFTEQSTVPQTVSHLPLSTTTLEKSFNSETYNVFSSFKPVYNFNTEETSTSKFESYTIIDETATSLLDTYSSSIAAATTDTPGLSSETYREGKHIPFSTASTKKVTDLSSKHGFLLVTTEKSSTLKVPLNGTEVHYMQIQIEDINQIDRSNMITAIIQFPVDSTYKTDMKVKLVKTHQWLEKVLTKEFQNWTRDPFEEAEEEQNEIPFGSISIFYVKPTPETNQSTITLTFIVYNSWRNRTLPVHFVLGTLNFYSKELKESINSSAVYFYHGLSPENYDLLTAVFDKYGIIIFTICIAVIGITILVCVVVFYRKKTRQSIHYLADSKLQQNLQEAVGIDLTPASIILQDEKEEKGSKICDDEGWLVPITDVPVAEDNNVPNVQDTKL